MYKKYANDFKIYHKHGNLDTCNTQDISTGDLFVLFRSLTLHLTSITNIY